MIDTHAHLDSSQYENDYEHVIESAFNDGVTAIIMPAVEPEGFEKIKTISQSHSNIYAAYGIHPHDALKYNSDSKELILRYLNEKNAVAVGEIGLDYFYDFCPKDIQQSAFRSQIQIALENQLPMIIHNRQADDDIINILDEEHKTEPVNAVLHCFSSSPEIALKAIEMGMHISFTGNITFKKTDLDAVVECVPLNRIMLETDSPYMAPVPYRGKRNNPAYIKLVAQKISEIKKLTIEEVISMTTQTAKTFFKLSLFLFLLLASVNASYSQGKARVIDREEFEEEEIVEKPKFERAFFGIGGYIATNTIVETYKKPNGDQEISYDGIFTPGLVLSISPIDFMFATISYSYSKNTKISEENKFLVGPTIHNVLQLNTHWIPNPGKRINFFGTLGITTIFNTINQGRKLEKNTTDIGLSVGLGAIGNIEIKSIGLFNIFAEWRLLFPFQESAAYLLNDAELVEYNMTKYFSMPKIGIIFYPEFLKNLW